MREENKKKLQKLKVFGYVISLLTVMWIWLKDFVDLYIHYEAVVLILGASVVYMSSQIALILKSEQDKKNLMNFDKRTLAIGFLWFYVLFLGILFIAIIPPQIRYLIQALKTNLFDSVFAYAITIAGIIVPILVALGIFVGGMFLISLKNWSRLLVIYSCLGIDLEIAYIILMGWSEGREFHLFLGFVFLLCAFPIFFLTHSKIRDQFK